MKEFRKSLPPLHALVAFEAAARLSSFAAAAHELNVSPAAVSQQIRNLEESLGVTLFARTHKAVQLTPKGREYQHTVASALQQLSMATLELRANRYESRLTVAADQSMAWMWLMPRLGGFYEAHPSISVRVVASDLEPDCLADDIDVALIHGRGSWPGYQSAPLFAEEVFPVCSAGYLETAVPLKEPRDLLRHSLLHLEDNHWDWINWRMWLTELGVALPSSESGLFVNNYPLLIEAAKNGRGIALGWRGLVDHEIDDGRLVKPLRQAIKTHNGYYAVWSANRDQSPEICAFVDWLSQSTLALTISRDS